MFFSITRKMKRSVHRIKTFFGALLADLSKVCDSLNQELLVAKLDIVTKYLAAISAGIPITITITNTNHKLTTSMKATKATNIQVRLLVEESQQLNLKM